MSDGNFNRSLLPYNNYQSGVRAGRAQMKNRALMAFDIWLSETFPDMTGEYREVLIASYKKKIDEDS